MPPPTPARTARTAAAGSPLPTTTREVSMTHDQLTIQTDRRLARALHHSRRYLLAEITAPAATGPAAVRPPVNVAFVIDRSGSMASERKLTLAIEAVRGGIGRLTPTDRFSVVTFDDDVDVVVPGTLATPDATEDALRRLDHVRPGGSTALGAGWLRGAEQVAAGMRPDGVDRTILLTDGQANVGIIDPAELAHHAAELRRRGVATTTFGYGEGFDERLLTAMSEAGGGSFQFIGAPADIAPAIAREVGELLEITARGVELRVAGADGIRAQCLGSFATTPAGDGLSIILGDLVADQVIRTVIEVELPLGREGRDVGVELVLTSRDGAMAGARTIAWTFADDRTNDTQARERVVDRAVARAFADRALREVVALNRDHRFRDAERLLTSVARRIEGYAGDDRDLLAIAGELRREADAWSVERMEIDRRVAFFARESSLRSRAQFDGSAVRRSR